MDVEDVMRLGLDSNGLLCGQLRGYVCGVRKCIKTWDVVRVE